MDLGGKHNTMKAYIFRDVCYLDVLHQEKTLRLCVKWMKNAKNVNWVGMCD